MLEAVITYIERYQLLPEQGVLVVAVSGGVDSLCLLHLLHSLCGPGKRYPAVRLHVAHLNHQLRGEEGEQDAAYVAQLAQSWGGLLTTIGSIDVPALARNERRSPEEAARIARYRFLREVAQGGPIAVAHHQDDQVETLILHWLRGGGISSMIGLQARQQDIIRPLLCVGRADTLAYCQQQQLTPLEDASNSDTRFLRNRVRHELLPLLASINPGIRKTLLRSTTTLSIDAEWIEAQVDEHWSQIVHKEQDQCLALSIPALLALPLSLQRHLLRRASGQLNHGQSPLELRHYQLLEELAERPNAGAELSLDLPGQLRAVRLGDTLTFIHSERHAVRFIHENTPVTLKIPGCISVSGTSWYAVAEVVEGTQLQAALAALQRADWQNVWRVLATDRYAVYVDGESTGEQLVVRTRRSGDRMHPLGMTHAKKIQDILIDRHIARPEREELPLFFCADRCIWLAGVQIDDRARLNSLTRRIVRLSIHKS